MEQYQLGPYTIMSNHVHALLLPKIHPTRLMKALKGTTAHEANRVLGRTGEAFWQAESYNHWVRNESEWQRIADYIEDNPVAVGLVQQRENYLWSSAGTRVETSLGAADTSVCATIPPRF